MGFKQDGYAKIWETENKGNYHVVKMSTSKKNKQTGEYETDFNSNFVRFIGTAHTDAGNLSNGERIKIGSCEVTNKYDKEKGKEFVNYLVYSFEKADDKPKDSYKVTDKAPAKAKEKPKPTKKSAEDNNKLPFDEDDEELPF